MKKVMKNFVVMVLLVSVPLAAVGFVPSKNDEFKSCDYVCVNAVFRGGSIVDPVNAFRVESHSRSAGINGWIYDDSFAGVWYDCDGNLTTGLVGDEMH